jgi:hypothetical protein
MPRKPVSSKTVLGLLAAVLVLPIAITVLMALAALLAAMGDSFGGIVVRYVALGCGVAWLMAVLCLVIAQGLNSLAEQGWDSPTNEPWSGRIESRAEQDEPDR